MSTWQEILEQICENRANAVAGDKIIKVSELQRKFAEIEWALQTIVEKLRDEND
jgi:hypothetical protein